MSDISFFDFETKPVRVIMLDDEAKGTHETRTLSNPHWVAADLATCLGYRDAYDMLRMLDEDQKSTHTVPTLGGPQSLSIVNESGMWTCVIRSNKPEAKRFVRVLTGEILPTLRQHGTYTMPGAEPPPTPAAPAAPAFDPAYLSAAVAVVREARRLFGTRAARNIWAAVGLPDPDHFAAASMEHSFPDGLVTALLAWVEGKDRLTYNDIGHGIGIGTPDTPAKHRIADILTARGWSWRNTKFGQAQRWTWRAPVAPALAGEIVQ
ncbi:BRO family protein [Novosphingobium sp.]|uniref:BRO-N domain-containing protein n=1 Tax=Novosphingobium sp. TaxID=1874826 RepID=UPI002603A3CA|nr:BRO family protein [Novosphingobium sp.]